MAFDLENGAVFWVWYFIKCHWHKKEGKPEHHYFNVKFEELPKHLIIRHRVPAGYISVRQEEFCFRPKKGSSQCFHKECILKYIKWINQQKKFGKWKKKGYPEDPFILRKNNPEHDWMIAFYLPRKKKGVKRNGLPPKDKSLGIRPTTL